MNINTDVKLTCNNGAALPATARIHGARSLQSGTVGSTSNAPGLHGKLEGARRGSVLAAWVAIMSQLGQRGF